MAGRNIEALFFDACNMAHLEALYEYRNVTQYMLASEITTSADGFDYSNSLATWYANYPLPARAVARVFVDESAETLMPYYHTLGVYSSAGVTELVDTLGDFADAVTAASALEASHFKAAMLQAYEPDDYGELTGDGVRDLKGFLEAYRSRTANAGISDLIDVALADCTDTVLFHRSNNRPNAHGIAVYLPSTTFFTEEYREEYETLVFNTDTGWLNMLVATGVPVGD